MFCRGAGSFKRAAIDWLHVFGWLGVGVGRVPAEKGGDEAGGVGVVAVVNCFPCSLSYLVNFVWIACNGAGRVVVTVVEVALECGEWFGTFVV